MGKWTDSEFLNFPGKGFCIACMLIEQAPESGGVIFMDGVDQLVKDDIVDKVQGKKHQVNAQVNIVD